MWSKETSKLFLLGCLYGFEKNNSNQILEFNCPKISYMLDFSLLLREIGVPFHIEKKGIRLLIVTDKIKIFNNFLIKDFKIDYNYPLKTKWPEFLDIPTVNPIPFIDGIFETAGMFTYKEDKTPFILHLQNENTIENISNILESYGIENIFIKNPNIKSLFTLQILDGENFYNKFLKTNPSSKYSNIFN